MDSLRPIFWGQGMFLQPQHFQQQDNYHESRLRRYLQLVSPFCWGVGSISINEAALRNFRFEIERCELITWEGSILRSQSESLPSNARIMPRMFEDALDPGGKPLGVYLGVKRLRWEEANVAPPSATTWNGGAADQAQRFSIHELTTPDLLTPDGRDCSVQYLCYEVQILFDDELTNYQDYELLKVAELLRSSEGQGAFLSRRYIPPCLKIHASAVLDNMLKELRELLTAKGRELSEYKRQHKMHTIDISSKDTVFLLMMQTVNRYIPLFHHHLEIEETHPCTVYALVRQLVGDLSTFSEDTTALGDPVRPLPPYRHDRLWECFDPALRLAKELLSEITKGPDYVVPLEWDGREYFAANNIEKRFFEGNNRYYLSIKVDIPPRELLALLTETGKIASHDDMPELRGKFLPGLKIDYQEIPPEELPRRAYYSYFLIDHRWALGVHLWRTIEERRDIAVFCELPPEKTEMRLLVIFGT